VRREVKKPTKIGMTFILAGFFVPIFAFPFTSSYRGIGSVLRNADLILWGYRIEYKLFFLIGISLILVGILIVLWSYQKRK
jgi:hypothetical protein